jgi:hypothetical protein
MNFRLPVHLQGEIRGLISVKSLSRHIRHVLCPNNVTKPVFAALYPLEEESIYAFTIIRRLRPNIGPGLIEEEV